MLLTERYATATFSRLDGFVICVFVVLVSVVVSVFVIRVEVICLNIEVACVLKDYINKLQNKEIKSYSEIPQEYHNDQQIAILTRNLGLREIFKCGYDVINQTFFVEENILISDFDQELCYRRIVNVFADFQTYFNFLDGNIYKNACYYQCVFTEATIDRFQLDVDALNRQSDLGFTVNDLLPEPSEDDKEEFDEIESQMSLRKKWISKYNACTTFKELDSVNRRHENSKDNTMEAFYLWNYINYHGEDAFDTIMEFVSSGQYPSNEFTFAVCFLFGTERVLQAYNYTGGAAHTNKKHNSQFKRAVEKITKSEISMKTIKFFDMSTHYYCEKTCIYLEDELTRLPFAELYKYFETFNEFTDYLGNDLSDCDLSNAFNLSVDFSSFKINNSTKLPIGAFTDLNKIVSKTYNRTSKQFEAVVKWYNAKGIKVFERKMIFQYFFDFVAFLNNDLSNADLLFCDGLKNITDFSSYNLENARMQSYIAKRVGLQCGKYKRLNNKVGAFPESKSNETETSVALKLERTELVEYEESTEERRIYYITDLHLIHRIQHAHCMTLNDCVYVIQRTIDGLLEELPCRSFLLIGGDVSSDFWSFKLFITLLRQTIIERGLYTKVIFVLGNHELWGFQGRSLDSITERYRRLISDNNMYLMQNELLYVNETDNIVRIPHRKLNKLTEQTLREKLRAARIVLFGGIGFSGYNLEFNANNGIYRSTISREEEVLESRSFEALYDRICTCLSDKKIVILTHMPFNDWHKDVFRQNGFVYVSGHNHKNNFYDDGTIRIYADNQVGYRTEHPKLKFFYINDMYDWFSDCEDGIHAITRDNYINFYRGKNLTLTFNRTINKLYMLKKNNYYCFIHESSSGGLSILNGGSLKALAIGYLRWYYDNMDAQIAFIKEPLDKYQSIQLNISKAINKIGGSGKIHGAIIDIDYYNHVYVNPYDLTVTPYYALDIITKYIYPNISNLLKNHCPLLYANYNKLLDDGQINALVSKSKGAECDVEPELYLSTDIYKASRQLKKMQKINYNILSVWYDNIPGVKRLTSK